MYVYVENNICAQTHECIRCTRIHIHMSRVAMCGCEFPSERFNFSTIASPSTIDAPLQAKKKYSYIRLCVCMCACTCESFTRIQTRRYFASRPRKCNKDGLIIIVIDTDDINNQSILRRYYPYYFYSRYSLYFKLISLYAARSNGDIYVYMYISFIDLLFLTFF